MSRVWICLFGSVVVLGLCVSGIEAQNQIRNWEFDEPLDTAIATGGWWMGQPANFTAEEIVQGQDLSGVNCLKIGIAASGSRHLIHSLLGFVAGQTYYMSFMAKATVPANVNFYLQSRNGAGNNWQIYALNLGISVTTEPKIYTYTFTPTATIGGTGILGNDIDMRLDFTGSPAADFYFDRIWFATTPPPSLTPPTGAACLTPTNGEHDAAVDTVLAWTPSKYANTHDVYLGTNYDSVSTASRTNPLDVLVSPGQARNANSYDPPGILNYGTTYYWRIDEINAPPTSTNFKGQVWGFTTELLGLPITGVIATSNTTPEATNKGPENTVNGSGLTDGEHSTDTAQMWMGTKGAEAPWIQFAFDRVYKLYDVKVWNHNSTIEKTIGFGLKDVSIDYSIDGITWSTFGTATFEKAPGLPTYAGNPPIALNGIVAKFVRFNVISRWGTVQPGKYGLSEVQFSQTPVFARQPRPAAGAANVALNTVLTWHAGRGAVSHNVLMSTNQQAVTSGTASAVNVSTASYAPALQMDTTYYWKVNEVNPAEQPVVLEGNVWSFSTPVSLVVDDFESYTNNSTNKEAIFQTWLDGYGYTAPTPVAGNGTGSGVGHFDPSIPDYVEKTIVHGGTQSMPLYYGESGKSPSEATRTFSPAQNWQAANAKTLVIWFQGKATNNSASQLYVKVNNSKVNYTVDPAAITRPVWMQWNIDLASLGTNLASVQSLTIGISSGSGLIYVDDIALYRTAPAASGPIVAWIEAETATIAAPWEIGNDTDTDPASGGKYIGLPAGMATNENPTTATVTIPFSVTSAGVYRVLLRVVTNGDYDSVWVRIADGTSPQITRTDKWVRANGMTAGANWTANTVFNDQATNSPVVEWTLAAGSHTLEITNREADIRIDLVGIQKAN